MRDRKINHDQLINELLALENFFEEGRKRACSTRRKLERFHAPAPSGVPVSKKKEIVKIVARRTEKIKLNLNKK